MQKEEAPECNLNFDPLPTEILHEIFSYLDYRSPRMARLACTKWFNIIRYSNFTIHFARVETLPGIIDRLSAYHWPLDLKFAKTMADLAIFKEFANRASSLTNLQSLDCRRIQANEDDILKLTDLKKLTSIETVVPMTIDFYMHFTKLKSLPVDYSTFTNVDNLKTFCQLEALEFPFEADSVSIDIIPTTLTHLKWSGKNFGFEKLVDLRHLTKLRSLKIETNSGKLLLPRTLEYIYAHSVKIANDINYTINGLENQQFLTQMNFNSVSNSLFCEQIKRLSQLVDVTAAIDNIEILPASDLFTAQHSKLTKLYLITGRRTHFNFTALPNSLRYLKVIHQNRNGICDITHLTNLQHLCMSGNMSISPSSNLTRLIHLESLSLNSFPQLNVNEFLLALTNLTQLEFDSTTYNSTLKHMTKLQDLNIRATYPQYISVSYLTNLTRIKFKSRSTLGWEKFVSNLTKLQEIVFYGDSDEELKIDLLLPLSKLTNLTVHCCANIFHLTKFTQLQVFYGGTKRKVSSKDIDEIYAKLTRLYSLTLLQTK